MGKADLHIHTRVSDGLATVERTLEYVQEETDLDVIAITDHEDVRGGLRAREIAARRGYRFEVLPGAEVTTLQGHLIALGVESCPQSFRRVESALDVIHTQDGLAIVPHPMSWLTRSMSRATIERVVAASVDGVRFDGIELGNPSPAGRQREAEARALNGRWGLAEVGGSDAHHLLHIGSGWTEFPGRGAACLREAIAAGTTMARVARYASLREVGFGRVVLGLAWGYAATPRKMLDARRWGGRGT
jgi:predicted metal-dependent phosphoesterase TrpH